MMRKQGAAQRNSSQDVKPAWRAAFVVGLVVAFALSALGQVFDLPILGYVAGAPMILGVAGVIGLINGALINAEQTSDADLASSYNLTGLGVGGIGGLVLAWLVLS